MGEGRKDEGEMGGGELGLALHNLTPIRGEVAIGLYVAQIFIEANQNIQPSAPLPPPPPRRFEHVTSSRGSD